jgi:hypothetical protein
MLRRLISSVALVACAGIYIFAAERATFILTDGERKSGPVVFHGDQHENLINGFLNLGADNGKEMTFPLHQVAVIDFVGGQPPASELAQLGTEHMLVTRDGTAQQGQLINLIGGDTLLWENLAEQRQQYAIRDVSRVYLNPQSARIAFNYTPPAAPPAAAQEATQATRNQRNQGQATRRSRGDQGNLGNQGDRRDRSARGVTVRVDPRQGWTDTGMTVNRGESLVFDTGAPVRELLGRIDNGAAFPIDTDRQPVAMRGSGRLMLGVIDDERRSNGGAFSVTVSRP